MVNNRCSCVPSLMVGAAIALAGCKTQQVAVPQSQMAAPAVAPELAPLAFMAGRWIDVNPNGSVAEEHWMKPQGKCMMGMFRLVRADASPQFFESSSITVEPEGVLLRLRHYHGMFDVQGDETEAQVFRLSSVGPGRAVFAAVAHTKGVASVTYAAMGDGQLSLRVAFEAGSGEKGFESVYTREITPQR